MQKSQLIQLLRTFSKKELRDLRKWLKSPTHNQREDVMRLYDYLLDDNHLHQNDTLTKENVFMRIFTEETTYNDAQMRQTMYFFLEATEAFLIYETLQQDEIRAKIALASAYRQRRLDKGFQKSIQQAKNAQQNAIIQDRHYLQNDYNLEQELYTFFEAQKRTEDMNLQAVSDTLDKAYMAEKLRQACLMLSHQKVYKANYEMGLLEKVITQVEENDLFKATPAIAIYYFIYKMLTNQNSEHHFELLKAEMQHAIDHFTPIEARDIYLMAINFCIGRMNAGQQSFTREAFELYKKGVESIVLIENNIISRWTFRNVVSTGMKLREFDWTEQFIINYQCYLEKKYRDSFVHYATASIAYNRGNYKTAMQMFSQADYDDILINLNAKTLLLKMLYEEGEYDVLESLLGSLGTYLHRKELIGYHKINHKNLIHFTKKLLRAHTFSREQKEKFKADILATAQLSEKQWLLEQLGKV